MATRDRRGGRGHRNAFDSAARLIISRNCQTRIQAMKKKAPNTKAPARRPPQSDAAKERVRRHLAGLNPLSLDPVEAAGAAFISPQERARIRYAQYKKAKDAAAARPDPKKKAPPAKPRRKPPSR